MRIVCSFVFNFKKQTYKPGSVFSVRRRRTSIIYLAAASLLRSSNLPLTTFKRVETGRAAPIVIYLVLQPMRRTAFEITPETGELLPHLFTLTLTGGYSLLHYYTLANIFLFRSTVPCIAQTFLFHICDSDRPACYATKIILIIRFETVNIYLIQLKRHLYTPVLLSFVILL